MDTKPQKGTLITSKDVAEWMVQELESKDGPLTRRRGQPDHREVRSRVYLPEQER